jgi:hypothetical protein
MNKRIEKWLTVCALGSWVASIGAMVAIDVTQPLWMTEPSQIDSGLNGIPYKSSEQTMGLSSHPSHWLDHDLPGRENSALQPSRFQLKTVQVGTSAEMESR